MGDEATKQQYGKYIIYSCEYCCTLWIFKQNQKMEEDIYKSRCKQKRIVFRYSNGEIKRASKQKRL